MSDTPVTVDQIKPYLTERGSIEVDLALRTLWIYQLQIENEQLRSQIPQDTPEVVALEEKVVEEEAANANHS